MIRDQPDPFPPDEMQRIADQDLDAGADTDGSFLSCAFRGVSTRNAARSEGKTQQESEAGL
ncbi:MAG: hypothetical protein ACKVG4_09325 [Longimicrobiales bacterium]|jgi:hypothetical protein